MKLFHELFAFFFFPVLGLHLDDGAGGGGGGSAAGGDAGAGAAGAQGGGGGAGAAGGAASSGGGAGAATGAAPSLIGADGRFVKGWVAHLGLPETLEAKFTDPKALGGSYVNLERMLGNQNKVAVPGPNATQGERDAFYKAIGRPDKAEEYGVKMPDKLPDGKTAFPKELWNQTRADAFTKLAHELGLSKEQVSKLAAFDVGEGLKAHEAITQASQKAIADAQTALKAEWGADYQKNLELAQKAAKEAGGDDLLKHPLANDPMFIKAMAKVGSMIVEEDGGAAGARGTSHAKSDPKQEIAAIRGDKNHPYHVKGHPQHEAAVRQMQALYEAAYPTKVA